MVWCHNLIIRDCDLLVRDRYLVARCQNPMLRSHGHIFRVCDQAMGGDHMLRVVTTFLGVVTMSGTATTCLEVAS